MEPKWQRARVVSQEGAVQKRFELVGREMWLRVERPETLSGNLHGLDRFGATINGIHCNIVVNGKCMVVSLDFFELLARDENDFADDVPLMPYEQWLKESAAEKGATE